MKTANIFLLICILFTSLTLSAQRPKKIDFKSKIDSINKINNKLARINDEASFLMSIKTTDRLIERVNYNFGISQHHLNLGIFQFNNGNFKSAVLNLNKSLNKAKIINNIDLINSVYSWKINTLFKLKDYLSCEEVLNESLKYLKFQKDTILSQKDTALVAKRLSFLSIISRLDSNFSKSLQLIDSSLFYSYAINDTLHIMKGLRSKAILLLSSDTNKSLKIFKDIVNISKKIKNPELKIESRFNLAKIFFLRDNLDSAILYNNSALKIIIQTNKKANFKSVLNQASEIYELKKDYKNAFLTNKKIDSLNVVYRKKLLSDNEFQKSNLKLKETQIKLKESKNISYKISILLFIMVLLVYFYINKSKNHFLEKKRLNKTKALENIAAQEEKIKQKIGEELHDNIGGSLAALKMRLSQLNDPNYYSSLNKEIKNLEEIYNQVREISSNLSVNPHIKESLLEKIEKLCQETFAGSKKVELNPFPKNDLNENFDAQLSNNVVRILKEVFTNIIKHANAEKINISITQHLEFLNLIISDNGSGFNTNKFIKGNGLRNIKNRAEIFNGEVLIDSKIGFGTTITINLMFKNKK